MTVVLNDAACVTVPCAGQKRTILYSEEVVVGFETFPPDGSCLLLHDFVVGFSVFWVFFLHVRQSPTHASVNVKHMMFRHEC